MDATLHAYKFEKFYYIIIIILIHAFIYTYTHVSHSATNNSSDIGIGSGSNRENCGNNHENNHNSYAVCVNGKRHTRTRGTNMDGKICWILCHKYYCVVVVWCVCFPIFLRCCCCLFVPWAHCEIYVFCLHYPGIFLSFSRNSVAQPGHVVEPMFTHFNFLFIYSKQIAVVACHFQAEQSQPETEESRVQQDNAYYNLRSQNFSGKKYAKFFDAHSFTNWPLKAMTVSKWLRISTFYI